MQLAAIHELPLHIVTEAFSTIDVFKKLNCYVFLNLYRNNESIA